MCLIMKIKDVDILIVPGYTNSGPDHWQSRWEAKLANSLRVEQDDWHKPVVEEWTANLLKTLDKTERPVVAIAHSLGSQVLVQAVSKMDDDQRDRIKGAFIVAPPDVENPNIKPKHLMTFGPYPRDPLPFPSIVVASTNDPFCDKETAADMANAWGSLFVDARESGHINAQSGHGPWPDGLMVFARFMARL